MAGRYRSFCSGEAQFTIGVVASPLIPIIRLVEAHTRASSSTMMACVTWSAPAPPYSTGMFIPGRSMATQSLKLSQQNSPVSVHLRRSGPDALLGQLADRGTKGLLLLGEAHRLHGHILGRPTIPSGKRTAPAAAGPAVPLGSAPMLALLFPGQGSQRAQMGAPWTGHPAWAVVDRLSEATGRDVAGAADRGGRRDPESHPQRPTGRFRAQPGHPLRGPFQRARVRAGGRSRGPQPGRVHRVWSPPGRRHRRRPQPGWSRPGERPCRPPPMPHPGTMAAVLGLDPDQVGRPAKGWKGPGRPTTTHRARWSSPAPPKGSSRGIRGGQGAGAPSG